MMFLTRGAKFQQDFEDSCNVQDIEFERIPDPVGGFKGVANFADYYVYNFPHLFYFELKSRQTKYFQIGGKNPDFSPKQYTGLLKKSERKGTFAGFLVEYYEHGEHYYFPIDVVERLRSTRPTMFSIKVEEAPLYGIPVHARLKRTRYELAINRLLVDIGVVSREFR